MDIGNEGGGPAFPQKTPVMVESKQAPGALEQVGTHHHTGITIRDYFAAAALTGYLSDSESVGSPKDIAGKCYVYADAMLEARKHG